LCNNDGEGEGKRDMALTLFRRGKTRKATLLLVGSTRIIYLVYI
jgi:hypothetical protein